MPVDAEKRRQMKEINQNIRENQFHKVYLLTGDEDYLIFQARQMLKKALVSEGDEMNYTHYEEAKINLSEVGDLAATYPFFSQKRLLLFNRTGILKSGKEEFVKILETMPETTCIIICESEVDKRSKAYKWIKKNGYVAEFMKKDQKEKTLLTFLARILAREKKQIREEDARYILNLVGDDLYQIRNEADKLIAYLGEETIVSREAIEQVISEQIQDKIFDMVTAIAQKDQSRALSYYNDLLLLKEPVMHILYLIVRQYRILLLLKSANAGRKSEAEMARIAGIPPFTVRRYGSQLRLYSQEELEYSLSQAVKLEEEIKTGILPDQIGLEMLLIRLTEDHSI